jgi:hypothetical protein
MNQASEGTQEEIKELVRRLFRSENHPSNPDVAADILADDYLPITRATGKIDENRKDTLDKIAKASPFRHREVDHAEIDVALFQDDSMAIARSRLPMTIIQKTFPQQLNIIATRMFS